MRTAFSVGWVMICTDVHILILESVIDTWYGKRDSTVMFKLGILIGGRLFWIIWAGSSCRLEGPVRGRLRELWPHRGCADTGDMLWRWTQGFQAKPYRWPLRAHKQGNGFSSKASRRYQPCWHLDLSPVNLIPASDLYSWEIINLRGFKPLNLWYNLLQQQ